MADCEYWKAIVAKLNGLVEANWAAHVLASDKENLAEARKCLGDAAIINGVISAYGDEDWSTQSYCDEVLLHFERETIEQVYEQMTIDGDDVRRGVERFLTL